MRCFYHPEKEAVGVCQWCGRAVCMECQRTESGKVACPSCSEEPSFGGFGIHFDLGDLGKTIRHWVHEATHCPSCNRLVKPDFKVCPYCQAPLKTYCSQCHRPLAPGWVVCPYCGQKKED